MYRLENTCCWEIQKIPHKITGLGYDKIFGNYLDGDVTHATLVDPFIRTDAQVKIVYELIFKPLLYSSCVFFLLVATLLKVLPGVDSL